MKRSGLFWQPEGATKSNFLRAARAPAIGALCRQPGRQRSLPGCLGCTLSSGIPDNAWTENTINLKTSQTTRCTGRAHNCGDSRVTGHVSSFLSVLSHRNPCGKTWCCVPDFSVGELNQHKPVGISQCGALCARAHVCVLIVAK